MSLLTYITQAEIRNAARELDGKVLTRPSLLVSDGLAMLYAVDVDIGQKEPLRNVPIARANRELLYAEVGAAVRLRRTESGRYEVSGFSQEQPGTYIRIPVTLSTFVLGPIEDESVTGRPLTYEELATLGAGYGFCPYGAVGIFKGGVLQEIRA
jgi:hypothetical protein